MDQIALVVVGYNRPDSMRRILHSLANAIYEEKEIPLVISIDHSGTEEVARVAREFEWNYGRKEVICHPERLGLRRHIISCGDLTERYGAVMILEDDLYVSPDFYHYATSALMKYGAHKKIAGIGLNTKRELLESPYPFFPRHTGYDVYFQQFATSWGQVWNRRMWSAFKFWYEAHPKLPQNVNVPLSVLHYPESSWAKFYQSYVVEQDLYYVFSYESLTTNFGDAGEHFNHSSHALQWEVFRGRGESRMPGVEEEAKYDVYAGALAVA